MSRRDQLERFMRDGGGDPNAGRRPGDPYIIARDSRPVGTEGLSDREREEYRDFLSTSNLGFRGARTPNMTDRQASKLGRMAFDQFRNLRSGGDYAPALRPGMSVPGGTVQRRETRNRGGLADFFGRGGFLGAIGEAIGGTAPKRIVRNVPPSSYMAPEMRGGIAALSRRNYRPPETALRTTPVARSGFIPPSARTDAEIADMMLKRPDFMPPEPLIETIPVLDDTPEAFAKVTKNEPSLIEEPLIETKRGATFDAPDRVTDNITNVFEDIPSGMVNIAMSSAQAAANAVEQEKARAAEAEQARRAALEALFTEAGLENMVGDGPVFELPPGTDPIDDFDMLTLGTTPLPTPAAIDFMPPEPLIETNFGIMTTGELSNLSPEERSQVTLVSPPAPTTVLTPNSATREVTVGDERARMIGENRTRQEIENQLVSQGVDRARARMRANRAVYGFGDATPRTGMAIARGADPLAAAFEAGLPPL